MNLSLCIFKRLTRTRPLFVSCSRNLRSFRRKGPGGRDGAASEENLTSRASSQSPDTDSRHNDNPLRAPVQELLKSSFGRRKEDVKVEYPSDATDYWKDEDDYKNWLRDQTRHAYRPKVDPKNTSILLFPGQGSQFVGMGKQLLDYPGVPDLYERASKILGYDLLSMCLHGPETELNKTVHQQPAVVVTSLAAVERLKHDKPSVIENCVGVAGFSVGEISALVFAGAFSFEDAVKLVKVRAEAMQAASEECGSGMMTVFLRPDNRIRFACLAARKFCEQKLGMEDPVCEIANYLFPECKVIAGHTQALDFVEGLKNEFGISRTKRLQVSGAFHTKLMMSARESVKRVLNQLPIQDPAVPVQANTTAKAYRTAAAIRKELPRQLHKPVLWEQTLHTLYQRSQGEDFPVTCEAGPGGQLGALLRKTNSKAFASYISVDI